MRQRPYLKYYYNGSRAQPGLQAVQGLFRSEGRLIKRVLAGYPELGLDADGEPPAGETKRAQAQRAALLEQRWAAEWKSIDAAAPPPAGPRIRALMQEWLDQVQLRAAPGTHALYLDSVNRYIGACGDHPLRAFTSRHGDDFSTALQRGGLAAATVNRHLRDLVTFLRWAWRRGELPAVPYVEKLPQDRRIPRVWSPEQLLLLFERLRPLARHHPHPRWRRFYLLHERFLWVATFTGMRRGEIVHLPWAAVDFRAGRVDVLMQGTFRTKERREKRVPLLAELAAYLWDQRARAEAETWLLDDGTGRPAYRDAHSLSGAFAKHYAELGLPAAGLRPKALHGFRATLTTALLNLHGLDVHTAGAWLGHSDPSVTLGHYTATRDGQLQRAARLVDTQPTGLLETAWKAHPDDAGKGKRAKRLRG